MTDHPDTAALTAEIERLTADKRFIMEERDKTFALMLSRVHKAEAERDAALARLTAVAPAEQEPVADHRSFPEAADGRPMPPMGDELMIAGLNGEDARFVAIQLAQNGLMLVATDKPGPVDGLEAPVTGGDA